MPSPTPEELEAARKRLSPYIAGYPEPMIDSRRLRISNGTASDQDQREVAAENQVIRELKGHLMTLQTPPPERYSDGTTSEDWKTRYSASVTISIRATTNVDYHSSAVESITLHFPVDQGIELDLPAIAKAAATVYSRWRAVVDKREAADLLKIYSPEQLLAAARSLEEKGGR